MGRVCQQGEVNCFSSDVAIVDDALPFILSAHSPNPPVSPSREGLPAEVSPQTLWALAQCVDVPADDVAPGEACDAPSCCAAVVSPHPCHLESTIDRL